MASRSTCCGTTAGELGWVVLGGPQGFPPPAPHHTSPSLAAPPGMCGAREPRGSMAHVGRAKGAVVEECSSVPAPPARAPHMLFVGVWGLPLYPVGPSRATSPTKCTV